MKRVLILLAIPLFMLTGCEKDENNNDDCKYGYVTVSNSSDNPYSIYIDGVFKTTVDGNRMIEVELNSGQSYSLKAIQLSGYIFYPTEVRAEKYIAGCEEYSWQIP